MFSLLNASHRPAVIAHLKRLSSEDRFMRFGTFTSDDSIEDYAHRMDFERDVVVGAWNGDRLIAVCHLCAYQEGETPMCELAISVDADHRRCRMGAQLMKEALRQAYWHGLKKIQVFTMRINRPMRSLLNASHPTRIEHLDDDIVATLLPSAA